MWDIEQEIQRVFDPQTIEKHGALLQKIGESVAMHPQPSPRIFQISPDDSVKAPFCFLDQAQLDQYGGLLLKAAQTQKFIANSMFSLMNLHLKKNSSRLEKALNYCIDNFAEGAYNLLFSFHTDLPKVIDAHGQLFENNRDFFGIHNPARYCNGRWFDSIDVSLLKQNLQNARDDGRPLAVALYNRHDHNNAYFSEFGKLTKLAENYRLIICEAESRDEAMERLKQASDFGAIDLVLFAAHGYDKGFRVGPGQEGLIKIKDIRVMSKMAGSFSDNPLFILYSCSTCKGGPGNYNFASTLKQNFPYATVDAFTEPAEQPSLLFENSGYVGMSPTDIFVRL